MSTDLLQALEIVTELRVDTVGENLRVFAIDDIALTIEEPGGNLVLRGVLDDGDNALYNPISVLSYQSRMCN